MQAARADSLGDGRRELRSDLVHVREPVGHRRGELLADGPLGHAEADLLRERQLPTKVVRAPWR